MIFETGTEKAPPVPNGSTVEPQKKKAQPEPNKSVDEGSDEEIPEDYGLLAYQWVDAHVMELNERINEAIGQSKADILITAEELPVQESWLEICKELERNDLTGASCRSDGILIEFEQ